jgi:hypothetical protein
MLGKVLDLKLILFDSQEKSYAPIKSEINVENKIINM